MVGTSFLSKKIKNQPLDVFPSFSSSPNFIKTTHFNDEYFSNERIGKSLFEIMWLWFSRKFCLKIVCLVISNIWLEVRID